MLSVKLSHLPFQQTSFKQPNKNDNGKPFVMRRSVRDENAPAWTISQCKLNEIPKETSNSPFALPARTIEPLFSLSPTPSGRFLADNDFATRSDRPFRAPRHADFDLENFMLTLTAQ